MVIWCFDSMIPLPGKKLGALIFFMFCLICFLRGNYFFEAKEENTSIIISITREDGTRKSACERSITNNPIMAWGKGCGLYWNSSFYKGWIYIYKYLNGDRYHMGGESECECIKQISKNVWGCVAKLTQIILSSKRISSFLDLS